MSFDPYFSDVVSLNHWDGANNATSSADVVPAVTWAFQGDAKLVTAEGMLGSSAALETGGSGATGRVVGVGIPDFGTGDFFIECLLKGPVAALDRVVIDQRPNAANGNHLLVYVSPANRLNIFINSAIVYTGVGAVFNGAIRQLRIRRVAGVLQVWVDGVQDGASVANTSNLSVGANGTYIGGSAFAPGTQALTGWLDELRITTGPGAAARDPSVLQTAPFPDEGGSGGGPTIDTQPADTTTLQGETATFTVAATGTGALLYQWFENGAFMLGESADTLTVTATLLRDGNTYTVRVTDDDGGVTSDPAELTVTPASSIAPVLQGPADVTVQEGQQAVFNVTAYGVGPFTYQWRVGGGAVVPGATSRVLTVPGLPQYDGAYYQVTVTDASGLVTASEYAQLTVTPEPVRGRGTADVDYPCALPGPLVAGNAYRSKSRVRRNDLASGPPIYRLEDDDGYELFNVAWSFSAGEVQVFRNWFRCDIASGSRLFNIWLMVDGAATRGGRQTVLHSCYFDGVPEYTQRGRRWSVSATLLAIREEAVDCCANLPDLYNGFCGELKRAINAFTDIWPATPPVPTVDLPIECQPYSCSALEAYAERSGQEFIPAYSPSAETWAYPFTGDSPVRYAVGNPFPLTVATDWTSGIAPTVPLAWQQSESAPVFCDGSVRQCVNLGYSGGQAQRGMYPAVSRWGSIGVVTTVTGAGGTSRMAGVVLRASDAWTVVANGIGGYQFAPRINCGLSATDLGGGAWDISAFIQAFGDTETPIPDVSLPLGQVGAEWVTVSAYVYMTPVYRSGVGDGIAVDFVAVLRVAGQTLTLSDTFTFASGASTVTYTPNRTPQNQSSFFREASMAVLSLNLIETFEDVDLDGADLALARNRPDYTPPPSCPAVP